MAQPYIGEIRQFAGNFAPSGWSFCNGALMSIAEYETLFVLIGTTYGGDGQSTFALPNLQGRFPIHMGTGGGSTYVIGQNGGSESVTLTTPQLPSHTHIASANVATGTIDNPANNFWAASISGAYIAAPGNLLFNPGSVSLMGGSQPHENMIPFTTVNYIISLYGIFPSQQ
jgi:microcystin-dependent protein